MNENIRLLKPFFRGLPIIIFVMVISVLAAKKYLNYVTPMYESTLKLKLADNREGVPSTNLYKDFDIFVNTNKIATEIEVMYSSMLIEKTLSKLAFGTEIYRKGKLRSTELFNDSPIIVNGTFPPKMGLDKKYTITVKSKTKFLFFPPGSKKGFESTFGKPIDYDGGKILIRVNHDVINKKKHIKFKDTYEFIFLSIEGQKNKMMPNLDIIPVDKDVPVIRISLKSNVPEKAYLFVNKLAETYISDYIETKYRAANTTVNFLNGEIENTRKRLSASEDTIQSYRDIENIINIRQETETELRKISQLKMQQTNLKMSLDAITTLNRYIAEGKTDFLDLATNYEIFNSLLSTELVKTIKRLQNEKKTLLVTYLPTHEKIKVIDESINDIIKYQIESVRNTEIDLKAKYKRLSDDIIECEKTFIGLPEREKLMNILTRDFSLNEKSYNYLNDKRIEAEIARSARVSFHKVISPGEIPTSPVSPIRSIIIIVSAILGMLIAITVIYLVHYAKAKVNDSYNIEKISTIPIALSTPFLSTSEEIRKNFLKEAVELELKGLIDKDSFLVMTSYDNAYEHMFHMVNFINAFMSQGRKLLLIDVVGNLSEYELANNDNLGYFDYSDESYLSSTKTNIENQLRQKMDGYDFCLVNNLALADEKQVLLYMSIATHNLFVLDSRKTSEKALVEVELLKDKYSLPNMWYVLNKAEYSPTIYKEFKKTWNKNVKWKNLKL